MVLQGPFEFNGKTYEDTILHLSKIDISFDKSCVHLYGEVYASLEAHKTGIAPIAYSELVIEDVEGVEDLTGAGTGVETSTEFMEMMAEEISQAFVNALVERFRTGGQFAEWKYL